MAKGKYHLVKKKVGRKRVSWTLLAGYAVLSAYGWIRLVASINDWYWLDTIAGIRPGPLYLVITGGLWGLIGLAALVWVFLALPRYREAGTAAALLFALTYWIDRLFITQYGKDSNLWFAVGFTVICLGYTALVLKPEKDARRPTVLAEEKEYGER
jgi:hypothetical protein